MFVKCSSIVFILIAMMKFHRKTTEREREKTVPIFVKIVLGPVYARMLKFSVYS